jgi:hypothetical protein
MAERVTCDVCGRAVPKHLSFVVRMDVYADPSVPEMSTEELEETDFDETFNKLLAEMKHMSADDLQDGVHRRFEFRLCPTCQRRFLANPLGMPRATRDGNN